MSEFNALDVANTTWAFAMAGQRDVPLFVALARLANQRIEDFDSQNLANTA